MSAFQSIEYERVYVPKIALEVYERFIKQIDDLIKKINLYNGDRFLIDFVSNENEQGVTFLVDDFDKIQHDLLQINIFTHDSDPSMVKKAEELRSDLITRVYEKGKYFLDVISKLSGFAQYLLTYFDRAVGLTKAPEIFSPIYFVIAICTYLSRHFRGYYIALPPSDVIGLLSILKTQFERLIKMVPRITPSTIREDEARPILLRFFFRKECEGCELLFRNPAFRFLVDLIGRLKKYEIVFHDCTIPESILVALTCGATLGDLELLSFRSPKSSEVKSKIKLLRVSAITPTLCGFGGVHTFISPSQPYEIKSALQRLGLIKLSSLIPYRFAKERREKISIPPTSEEESVEKPIAITKAKVKKKSPARRTIRPVIYYGEGDEKERYIYIGDVAKVTGYSHSTLRVYIHRRRLSGIKVDNRYWYVRERDLLSDPHISRRYTPVPEEGSESS